MLHPVVLAGGTGTRLWPLSRNLYPKQLLSLLSDYSLFQETLTRVQGITSVRPPTVVTSESHQFIVSDQLNELCLGDSAIIVEREGRNTAPALTLAALNLRDHAEEPASEIVMLVMPADHTIRDTLAFKNAVEHGMTLAQRGWVVTFGICPTSPNTGYGYIKKGDPFPANYCDCGTCLPPVNGSHNGAAAAASPLGQWLVSDFVEKPSGAVAAKYVSSGTYLWNSGMFMLTPESWLGLLQQYRPDILQICQQAHAQGRQQGNIYHPNHEIFAQCPSESIDIAVMEKIPTGLDGNAAADLSRCADPLISQVPGQVSGCAVIPLNVGWSDIGSWSSLWEEEAQDDQGNVIKGDVRNFKVKNSLLYAQHRLVTALGVEDIVIVETSDAVLVARKDAAQEVKDLVALLKTEGRSETESHRRVHRPWGMYDVVDSGPGFQVKRLTVVPGGILSLQLHHHRAEHWVVVQGTAKVTQGEETRLLQENQSTYIPLGTVHRLENPGSVPLEVIEVQFGDPISEDDIVRFEDHYNRVT